MDLSNPVLNEKKEKEIWDLKHNTIYVNLKYLHTKHGAFVKTSKGKIQRKGAIYTHWNGWG